MKGTKAVQRSIALVMCILLVIGLVGFTSGSYSEASKASFKAGTYTGTAKGHGGTVKVETKFSADKIISIKVLETSETVGVGDAAVERMPGKIVEAQSLAVDVVSGATEASNAIIDAVKSCVKQAGGDPQKLMIKTTTQAKTVNMSADVVVVGAGASGTAAALAAVDAGSKVILLEKTSVPAGAGTLAGGMFATNSKLQKDAGIPDASEWLYNQYMESSNYRANGRLVRHIIDESGPTVDWLMENGAKLKLADPGVGGQPVHQNDPKEFVGYAEGGFKAITALHESIKKKGGQILFDTAGKSLITNKQGEIVGINAIKTDGTKLAISAKSVVLATGGFAGNAEMMAKYFGKKAPLGAIASATGDGLQMAWKAGAAEYGANVGQFFFFSGGKESDNMKTAGDVWNLGAMPLLWVNKSGERFVNEEAIFEFAAAGNVLYEQPDAMAWVVFDQGTIDKIKQKGFSSIADIYGKWRNNPQSYYEFNEPVDTVALNKFSDSPYDLTPFLEEGVKTGEVVKADSFAELGQKSGMDKQTFESTAKRYASMGEQGKDTEFFKNSKYLSKLNQGPYYAMKIQTRTLTTLGGVKVNENVQAVDANAKAIPGLWAAGSDAGGVYGNSYVMFEGGTLGFAYTSGRIAGVNAAAYAKSK